MTRKLKALGLALMAVLAFGAMVANAAEAKTGHIKLGAASGTLLGDDAGADHTFTLSNGTSLTCSETTFHAKSVAETSTSVTVEPTFKDCHVIILGLTNPVTVTMNGCDFNLNAGPTEAGTPATDWTGTVDVKCPAGQQITVDVFTSVSNHNSNTRLCELHVAEQSGRNHFLYKNGASEDLFVEATVGVSVKRTGSSLCGAETQEATYKGNSTIKATTTAGVPTSVKVETAA